MLIPPILCSVDGGVLRHREARGHATCPLGGPLSPSPAEVRLLTDRSRPRPGVTEGFAGISSVALSGSSSALREATARGA